MLIWKLPLWFYVIKLENHSKLCQGGAAEALRYYCDFAGWLSVSVGR